MRGVEPRKALRIARKMIVDACCERAHWVRCERSRLDDPVVWPIGVIRLNRRVPFVGMALLVGDVEPAVDVAEDVFVLPMP
jgi:hypothetical protein